MVKAIRNSTAAAAAVDPNTAPGSSPADSMALGGHRSRGPRRQAGLQHLPTPFHRLFFLHVSFHGAWTILFLCLSHFSTPHFLKMMGSTCLRTQAGSFLTCGGFEGPSRLDLVWADLHQAGINIFHLIYMFSILNLVPWFLFFLASLLISVFIIGNFPSLLFPFKYSFCGYHRDLQYAPVTKWNL